VQKKVLKGINYREVANKDRLNAEKDMWEEDRKLENKVEGDAEETKWET
jgi:hypothetical protein